MRLITVAPGAPFLPELARLWTAQTGQCGCAAHDGLILLPTRRAARGLAAAFLEQAGGDAILLPRIVAFGALDEAPLALEGALTLPPAITEPHRHAALARMILAAGGMNGAALHSGAAWTLATDLAALMDEAERAGVDLAQALKDAAEPAQAEHWLRTLQFLQIVTDHWPAYLADNALMNPAARQAALMDAQIAAWQTAPPATPILAVGLSGDIPSVARLLHGVLSLPHGALVLPGLDATMDDATWAALDEAHPQYGLRTLLEALGARRADVAVIGETLRAGRASTLQRALVPAAALQSWRTPFVPDLAGITRLAAADEQEEAVAIAMILRDALERPGARAALVTPDRSLAARVAAELTRWGVVADDSAGESLAATPPAVFLRLIAAAVTQRLAPVALLALLKHPLAGAGLAPGELRQRARALERACLRGPAPAVPGLAGLRRALDGARRNDKPDGGADPDALDDLLARLDHCLEPLLRLTAAAVASPADLLAALVQAAEALAAAADTPGPARLWALEEGEALAALLAETLEALPPLPPDRPDCLPGLLDAVLAGSVVRSRRAIRGGGGAEHPRIFIWGLLEARLQDADVLVLGGLCEGVWPPATDPGPWMSRPMRARAGLISPELRVGQTAHDFWMACCAAPRVVLSAPRRRDGAPAVPSRWLTRLAALAGPEALAEEPAADWARRLDLPAAPPRPVPPPAPKPPVAARPRRLSVTEIATLLDDPYAIYARHVLGLEELAPLAQMADFSEYGSVVHRGLHRFVAQAGIDWPADAEAPLAACLEAALHEAGARPALVAWWTPRLRRIAAFVDAQERRRRATPPPLAAIATERRGEWVLDAPAGPFALVGRADRIERDADGAITIIDYKTGQLPSRTAVAAGRAPQLPLEGAMAQDGRFGADCAGPVLRLTYWRLSGDRDKGSCRDAADPADVTDRIMEAERALTALIAGFDDPETAYPARAYGRGAAPGGYAQLARAAEWAGPADDAEEDDDTDETGDAEAGETGA